MPRMLALIQSPLKAKRLDETLLIGIFSPNTSATFDFFDETPEP